MAGAADAFDPRLLRVFRAPAPKRRLGNAHDGGYVVCALPGGYGGLLSGGVGGDDSFERAFLGEHDVPCWAFDGTVAGTPSGDPRIALVRRNLGPSAEGGPASGPDGRANLAAYAAGEDAFLKMDIEGGEHEVLPGLDLARFKQIVIEVHWGVPGFHPHTPADLSRLLAKLDATHTLVHLHGNNGGPLLAAGGVPVPAVFECTYVRSDLLAGPRVPAGDPIPSPLDAPNCHWLPDIVLRGWPYGA